MAVFWGDTPGSLAGKQQGGSQTVSGNDDEQNTLWGDAGFQITDNARGGDDILVGGTVHAGGTFNNFLFGDSEDLSGKAQGGNDTLTGGNQDQSSSAAVIQNHLYGDAFNIFGFARGGDDRISGMSSNSNVNGVVLNELFGDGESLSGKALGGNDTVTGGNSSGTNNDVMNFIFGDARNMSDAAKGGDDVLIAGTGNFALNPQAVANSMVGDANVMSGLAKGGADTFVFHDNGPMTVGTNNHIGDFSQSQHDKIMFIGVAGVATFADLTFDTTTELGSTIVHAGADAVRLVGFTGTLTEHDFLFG